MVELGLGPRAPVRLWMHTVTFRNEMQDDGDGEGQVVDASEAQLPEQTRGEGESPPENLGGR